MNRTRVNGLYFLQILLFSIASVVVNTQTSYAQVIASTFKHPVYTDPEVFVITNRQTDTLNAQFSFTNQVKTDPSLTFYKVNASSTASLQLTRLDSVTFIREILEIKNQDWLLFVHGDSKTFEEAVIRGLNIQNMHKIRVIVFAWPSKDVHLHGYKNFKTSHQNVEKSVNHFNSVLATMAGLRNQQTDFLHDHQLSLFLHSLGNYFLECLGNKNMFVGKTPLLFDNVIINEAAVEEKNHTKWVEQIHFQKQLFINSNKWDIELKGLRIFTTHGRQLGEKVTSPFASNATYFNFSQAVGLRIRTPTTHTYFIGKVPEKNKQIRLFYSEILHGHQPNLTDETRFKRRRKPMGDIIVKK